MNDDDFIIFGQRDGWAEPQPFGISSPDRRRHVYAIGQTGSGKTTLLRNLIVQHVAAGHGVGVIDPHGDLAEELLNHIPPSRGNHVCYFKSSVSFHGMPGFLSKSRRKRYLCPEPDALPMC